MIKTELGDIQLLQPWSTFVMKVKMPNSLVKMALKMTDDELIEKNKYYGKSLAGQIDDEWGLEQKLSSKEYKNLHDYLLKTTSEYAIKAHSQSNPDGNISTPNPSITQMWVVSQKDNEYNPLHMHMSMVSAVFYLKVPKFLSSKKQHADHTTDDGSIIFINNTSANGNGLVPWGNVNFLKIVPKVGDMYLFPSNMNHMVYPFRTSDNNGERRSVSFNAFV